MNPAPDFSPLSTTRLELETLSKAHSAGVFSLWSSAEVCRFSGEAHDWNGQRIELPARSAVDSDKILDFFMRRATEGSGVRWAVISKQSARFMGAVGLNALRPRAELAYHFHPDHWGAGYATEACSAVMDWCWSNLPNVPVDAFIEAGNTASIRLAERLGFEATASSRDGAKRYVLERRIDTLPA